MTISTNEGGFIVDPAGSSDDPDAKGEGWPLGIMGTVYYKLNSFIVRRTKLWQETQRFGNWLESRAVLPADETHEGTISIELDSDETGGIMRIGPKRYADSLNDHQRLWRFLYSLGVKRVEFDSRLERNQVVDIMTLLYSYRRKLRKHRNGKIHRGIVGHILGKNGLHVACACVSIKGETLVISYTYCTLAFSRLMRWFEQKYKKFHDHRALFHFAPRCAVLVGAA